MKLGPYMAKISYQLSVMVDIFSAGICK